MVYYFDNSATTMPEEEVLQTYLTVSTKFFANPSSIHLLGVESRKLLEQARNHIAHILNLKPNEVYFTASGTESNNWFFQAILAASSKMRPEAKSILISPIEHPSVSEQAQRLVENGFNVVWLKVDSNGVLDLEDLAEKLDSKVLCLSTMAVNNEVGTVQPLSEIADILQQFPQIIWHVDAVQAVTTQLALLNHPRIDAVTLSGHKFHAGRGTGILTFKERLSSQPLILGGGQEKGLRSGTENLASIVATTKALRLAKENQDGVKMKLANFQNQIIDSLTENQWQVFAENVASEHIICAALPSIPGEVLVHAFEEYEVMVSTTSACSSRKNQNHHTLKAMKIADHISQSAIRISMSAQTGIEDVNALISAINNVTKKFQRSK